MINPGSDKKAEDNKISFQKETEKMNKVVSPIPAKPAEIKKDAPLIKDDKLKTGEKKFDLKKSLGGFSLAGIKNKLQNLFSKKDSHLEISKNDNSGPEANLKKAAQDLRNKERRAVADSFSNPKILEVDLMKDHIEISFDWKRNLTILGAFLVLSCLIVTELYVTMYLWEKNEIYNKSEKLKEETQQLNSEIEQARANAAAALDFQERINLIEPIFNNHIYWSNFFKYLEKNTLADVYYSGFVGDVASTYALRSTVKDFRAIGVQLKTFLADKDTSKANIANEKINNNNQMVGVLFDLTLAVKKALFTDYKE